MSAQHSASRNVVKAYRSCIIGDRSYLAVIYRLKETLKMLSQTPAHRIGRCPWLLRLLVCSCPLVSIESSLNSWCSSYCAGSGADDQHCPNRCETQNDEKEKEPPPTEVYHSTLVIVRAYRSMTLEDLKAGLQDIRPLPRRAL